MLLLPVELTSAFFTAVLLTETLVILVQPLNVSVQLLEFVKFDEYTLTVPERLVQPLKQLDILVTLAGIFGADCKLEQFLKQPPILVTCVEVKVSHPGADIKLEQS